MIRTEVELLDEQDPVLALAIHNGHEMHPELATNCGISETDRLREEDPFTDVFARAFSNRIIVYTSRFTVDLNRRPEQAIYQKLEDCWGLQARINPLSEELLTELKNDYWQWYSVLSYTVCWLLEKHPFLHIVDLHSFNHRRGGPDDPPDPQEENPDIILGRNNLPEKFYPWVERLRGDLNGKDLMGINIDCRADVKFPGGYVSRWLNKTYGEKVQCLAVEFKKIFMDEWTGRVDHQMQTGLCNLFYKAVRDNLAKG